MAVRDRFNRSARTCGAGYARGRSLKDIEAAFICMNLPSTMDVKQAARAVLIFRPRIVYPYHYRGQGGTKSDVEMFRALIGDDQPIDVRLRDWYVE